MLQAGRVASTLVRPHVCRLASADEIRSRAGSQEPKQTRLRTPHQRRLHQDRGSCSLQFADALDLVADVLPNVPHVPRPTEPTIKVAERADERTVASHIGDELARLTKPSKGDQQEGHIDLLTKAGSHEVGIIVAVLDPIALHRNGANRVIRYAPGER